MIYKIHTYILQSADDDDVGAVGAGSRKPVSQVTTRGVNNASVDPVGEYLSLDRDVLYIILNNVV